jgi:hypothetical protein
MTKIQDVNLTDYCLSLMAATFIYPCCLNSHNQSEGSGMLDLVLEFHKDTCSPQVLSCSGKRIRTWKTLETIKRYITTISSKMRTTSPHLRLIPANTCTVWRESLTQLVHTDEQRRALALPGNDVPFRAGRITPAQVQSHRPSYVNAILRHSDTLYSCKC